MLYAQLTVAEHGYHWVDSPDYALRKHADWIERLRRERPEQQWKDPAPLHQAMCRVLTDGVVCGQMYTWTVYGIDAFPGLYLKFANLHPTEDDILTFANQYGTLGTEPVPVLVDCMADGEGKQKMAHGETFDDWCTNSRAMWRAVELWNAATTRNFKVLRQRIHWDKGDTGVSYRHEDDKCFSTIARPHLREALLPKFAKGDLVRPALYQVQQWVNEHLKLGVYPCLLWDEGQKKLHPAFNADGLLSALWWQFAQEISAARGKPVQICIICGEPITDAKRRTRIYHDGKCAKRAYRAKKKEKENGASTP